MKTAIVLSGGGSKGSYQLGVWKALRRLHIKYDIVTGTSIGALNGALMTEKSYFKAKRLWNIVNLEYLFNQTPKTNKSIDVLKLFGDNFIKNGGMEIENIERIIEKSVNKRKFYKSKIDFGLVTYNITTNKPILLSKNEIEEDHLVDYLMASATCFPAFQIKEIDGEKYVDGGIYDNMPIDLAIDLGATNLIIVDLAAPGIKRKVTKIVPNIYIKPKNDISFFLNFDEKEAKINAKFGYNDTMKAFNKLDGDKFTFKKNSIKKFYYKNRDIILDNKEKNFLESLENLGQTFKLDETKIYSVNKFIKLLKKEISKEEELDKVVIKEIKNLNTKTSSKPIILYFLSNIENNKNIKKPSLFFKKEYKLANYLHNLGVYYGK